MTNNNKDNFFMEVSNTKPFFKAAFEGFAGSGKTYTAAIVAIGLHKRIKSTKPVVMFDTEKAAKFLKRPFAEAGIELMVRESKTLADLKETMKRLRENKFSDILIIDSISHVWEDTTEAYKRKINRSRLQFQDWGILKPTWKNEFSDPFVNDPYHIIMCGRAGYEYDYEVNEDTKKKELVKSGVKMKVEGETAYEPDILVLMERFEEILGENKKVFRQATVIKDRSRLIDGKTFINPTYKEFSVAIEDMLDNPTFNKQSEQTDSTGLFKTEEDKQQYFKAKDIALEEIEGELLKAWPSTGAQDKQEKLNALESSFGTRSWTAIQSKGLSEIQTGLTNIRSIVTETLKNKFPDVVEKK